MTLKGLVLFYSCMRQTKFGSVDFFYKLVEFTVNYQLINDCAYFDTLSTNFSTFHSHIPSWCSGNMLTLYARSGGILDF